MKQNHSIKEIGEQLLKANSALIFPHINMDGDALGSAAALCKVLRDAGKDAAILIEDEIPEYISFLDNGYCSKDFDVIQEPDVCICVDCGETDRFPKRAEKFFTGKTTICVDHHTTSTPFADYNFIDGNIAATCEIIYKIIVSMGLPVTKEIGEAIYTGISTDTGNFQYSNATRDSHIITAALYDAGIDHSGVAVKLYQSTRLEKIRITNRVLDNLQVFAGGKAAMAYVDQNMLEEVGAAIEETEGVVETLRNIQGVEVAAFLKEREPDVIKVSMRAKTNGNVADIASKFGGGGHIKAAGCTFRTNLKDACEQLKAAIEESLRDK